MNIDKILQSLSFYQYYSMFLCMHGLQPRPSPTFNPASCHDVRRSRTQRLRQAVEFLLGINGYFYLSVPIG